MWKRGLLIELIMKLQLLCNEFSELFVTYSASSQVFLCTNIYLYFILYEEKDSSILKIT